MTDPGAFPQLFALADCRHGRMLYPVHDRYVGKSLALLGEYCEEEVQLFRAFVPPGATALDVGANIGAHTVALARMTGPQGLVIAFEPQPVLHQVLSANAILNNLLNIQTFPVALGERLGTVAIPPLDYSLDSNFGSYTIGTHTSGAPVQVVPLDRLKLERCDFMKVDVEGHELRVLEGAVETLERHRPALYVENDRREQSPDLIRFLEALGYRLWWHLPPLFRKDNFNRTKENPFGPCVAINLIAVPKERAFETNAAPVAGPDDWGLEATTRDDS